MDTPNTGKVEEEEEAEELDAALLRILEFLEEVFVNLSEFIATEEHACEQYATSLRFLRRCFSGSPQDRSDSVSDSHMNPTRSENSFNTGSKNKVQKGVAEQSSNSTQSEFPAGPSMEEVQKLCDSVDLVLAQAKNVREKHHKRSITKSGRPQDHDKKLGDGPVDDDISKAAKKKLGRKVIAVAKAGERPKKLIQRISNCKEIQHSTLKSSSSKANLLGRSEFQSILYSGTNLGRVSDHKHEPPQMTVTVRSNSPPTNAEIKSLKEQSSEHLSAMVAGKEEWDRSCLQFPERLTALLTWFESTNIPLNDPSSIPRIQCHAAEEGFLSALNQISIQKHDSYATEAKDAALLIRKTQKLMKELASHVSPIEMDCLLRIAPTGSTVSRLRDAGVQRSFIPQQGGTGITNESEKDFSASEASQDSLENRVTTAPTTWLPESCWEYLDDSTKSFMHEVEEGILQILADGVVHYTEPQEILVTAKLWHVIHMTLFQCYLEEVIASSLLPKLPQDFSINFLKLLRMRLAHSILCKGGQSLLVMARRSTEPF